MKNIVKHFIRGISFASVLLVAMPLYAGDLADSLIGQWEGRKVFTYYSGSSGSNNVTLTIRRSAETGKLVGEFDSFSLKAGCTAKQSAKIYVHGNNVEVHGTVESTTCTAWNADLFELTLSSDGGLLAGTTVDVKGSTGKINFYKQ